MIEKSSIGLFTDFLGNEIKVPIITYGKGSPHVVLLALQHGQEVIALDTAHRILGNQEEIIGRISLVCVANYIGFSESTRLSSQSYSDSTGQVVNMNRRHPGFAKGNLSDRTSYSINTYIKKLNPDYIIDLHSYSSQSVPHIIVDKCQEKIQVKIINWARSSHCPWYMEYEDSLLMTTGLNKALSAYWVKNNVPAITLELGPIRSFSVDQSRDAVSALTNVLRAIAVLKGKVDPRKHMLNIDFHQNIYQRIPLVNAGNCAGYLRPVVSIGETITKDQVLAHVVRVDGTVISKILAPYSGVHFIWGDEVRVLPGSQVGVMIKLFE